MLIIDSQLTLKHFFVDCVNWRTTHGDLHLFFVLYPDGGKLPRTTRESITKCCVLIVHIIWVYTCTNLAALEDQKHPRHQAEIDLASPAALLISLSRNSLLAKSSHQSPGSDLSVILRGLKKGQKKEISFWNKTELFSSFLLILMHVLQHAK